MRKESGVRTWLWRVAAENWKVVLYAILIALCVIFAPAKPLKFIYTEF
jgi:hypothetical protein